MLQRYMVHGKAADPGDQRKGEISPVFQTALTEGAVAQMGMPTAYKYEMFSHDVTIIIPYMSCASWVSVVPKRGLLK